MTEKIRGAVHRLVNTEFGDLHRSDALRVTDETTFEGDLDLDELDRVEFVMAVEEEFNIDIADEDVWPNGSEWRWKKVGDVVAYLIRRGVAPSE